MRKISTEVMALTLSLFFLLPAIHLHAQYRSAFDTKGNVKSVETRRYEENRDNLNKVKYNNYSDPVRSSNSRNSSRYKSTPVKKPIATSSTAAKPATEPTPTPTIKYNLKEISEGLIVAQFGDKFGYVDATGNQVIPMQYDHASEFKEGLGAIKIGEKYGFINKESKVVIPAVYERAGSSYREGCVNNYTHHL